MKKDPNAVYISLTGYSETTLDLANYIGNLTERVYLSGTLALTQNLEILYTGVVKAHTLEIYSTASVTRGDYQYVVLGRTIPTTMSTKRWAGLMLASGTNTPQFFLLADFSQVKGIGLEQIDLDGQLTDTHVKTGASISLSKLASLTASRVPVIGGDGKLAASTITDTILGYLSGLSSNVQDQLDSKLDSASTVDGTKIDSVSASKVTATASRAMVTDVDGKLTPSAVTAEEIGYLDGVTENIKTSLDAKIGTALTRGSILVGNSSNIATPLDANDDAKILIGNGTDLNSVSVSGDISITSAGVTSIGNDKVTPAKVSAEMRKEVLTYPISFEAGFTNITNKIRLPYACSLTHVHFSVAKVIAGTNDATITFSNHTGSGCAGASLSGGALTVPQNTPAGSVIETTVTGNNAFTSSQQLQIKADKVTNGGSGVLTLEFTRS